MKIFSFAAAVAASFTGASAFAVGPYSLSGLGNLGESPTYALDVNSNRQVSGNSTITAAAATAEGATGSRLRAFSWSGGTMTNLGVLLGATTNRYARGYAVNDAGYVVGEFNNDSSRAFVYNPTTGMMSGLTRLAGGSDAGVATDINNVGVIAGVSSNGTASRATRWVGGTPSDLGSIDGLTTTPARATSINQAGVVAGYSRNTAGTAQATLWNGATITNLTSLGDGTKFSQAFGLNASNVVVGSSYTGQTVGDLIGTTSTTDVTRAFVYSGGAISELSPVNLYTSTNIGVMTNYHSVANDINDAGLIVGNSARISGSPAVATLWDHGVAIDLNKLIDPASGWVLRSAEGINDAGDIVGYGTYNGATQAFLLTAVPEPASLGAAAMVGVALLRRTRRA